MGYIALYRKWRPQVFSDMVGQQHAAMTLKNALTTGRVAHAYLFSGPRGTGKTSMARIMAKALNCKALVDSEPCNQCDSCLNVNEGHEDLSDIYEIDAASNRGIDEIRQLRENIKFSPLMRYKVYIIDEVHMLTTEAFNAILKTLEEPPSHAVFILATTEIQKLPSTILSRCQRYDFRRITVRDIAARLRFIADAEGISADDDALQMIARGSGGGLRDAVNLLDQCNSFAGGQVRLADVEMMLGGISPETVGNVLVCIRDKDIGGIFTIVEELVSSGRSLAQLNREILNFLRNLLLYQESAELVAGESEVELLELKKLNGQFAREDLLYKMKILAEADEQMKWALEPRIYFEISLVRMTLESPSTAEAGDVPALQERLDRLERLMSDRSRGSIRSEAVRTDYQHPVQHEDEIAEGSVERLAATQHTPAIKLPENKPEKMIAAEEKEKSDNRRVGQEDLAHIRQIWKQVLKNFSAKNPLFNSSLKQVFPVGVKGNHIFLTTENPLAESTVSKKKDYLIEQLQELTGTGYQIDFIDPKRLLQMKEEAAGKEVAPSNVPAADQAQPPSKALAEPARRIPDLADAGKGKEPVMNFVLREFGGRDVTEKFRDNPIDPGENKENNE